ncbi:MAG: geranyl transferase, partial [Acutalibacteraceae bacterium]|nr:geranyl transferase [Acutalibacteraceae bacterium]
DKTLGKPTGSDGENGKSTFVSHLNIEGSLRVASKLTAKAKKSLEIFGSEGEFLCCLADKLYERKN